MKVKTLGERWTAFWAVVADPWNGILLAATGALLWATASTPPPTGLTSALLFLLVTIAAAILGARVTQQWAAITEQSVVQARGIAAVRSLKLLLRNIAALEGRVREFRANEMNIATAPEVTKRNFEEIRAACIVLQEEAVSSIENWTDIVEEADVRTQIGVITTLKADLDMKSAEVVSAKADLAKTEGRSAEARKSLQSHIAKMEHQVAELQKQLFEKSLGFGGAITTGTSSLSGLLNIARPTENVVIAPTSGTLLYGGTTEKK